ncbi:MAG: ATP-binding cassette domain-containing protein [Chloroflexota bacterium]
MDTQTISDPQQGIQLEAKNLYVCKKNTIILQDVSFAVQPGTLTAIIGPNGAGKTTLMRALSGERPDRGQVIINGKELYAAPQYWLQTIGYVPVDNILHEQLTLYQALVHIGKLRLPDCSEDEIAQKVDTLLTEFDFPPDDERRQRLVRSMSSGERKRANICSELLVDPPLLMLDEPTSNLDPDAERNLMHLLAQYAHKNGKTILVITHTLNTIDVCDEVIFIENSILRAAGKREDVLVELESQVEDVDANASSFYRWAQVFEHYKTRNERLDGSHMPPLTTVRTPSNQAASADPVLAESHWWHQLRCLLRRYTQIRMGDRWSLAMTLLAGLSGVLFFILPGNTFIEPFDPSEASLALNQARQSVYVVSLVVTLIGLITSYTEISKEYHIYRHERLKGLQPSAYFLSKWIWLVLGVGILAPLLLMGFIVLIYMQPLPGFPEPRFGEVVTYWEQLYRFQLVGLFTTQSSWLIVTTLVLASITSVTLGLLISALAGGSDKGYLYLSFVVVFIVLFSGLIQNNKLERLVDTFSFLSTGKWAFEGFASSISVYCWLDSWRFAEFNSTGHLASIWLSLAAFTLGAGLLSVMTLQLDDPWYNRWINLRRFFVQGRQPVVISFAILTLLLSYTLFLRQQSHAYHSLNYWSRQEYGGTNAYEYANVQKVADISDLQYWNGKVSQSWCGDR